MLSFCFLSFCMLLFFVLIRSVCISNLSIFYIPLHAPVNWLSVCMYILPCYSHALLVNLSASWFTSLNICCICMFISCIICWTYCSCSTKYHGIFYSLLTIFIITRESVPMMTPLVLSLLQYEITSNIVIISTYILLFMPTASACAYINTPLSSFGQKL